MTPEGAEPPGWSPERYGEDMAEVYDEWFGTTQDTELAVDFLARLAGEGPPLELGVGTGRVALPLARRGIEVHGIDASEAMVGKLREKPGGEDIPVEVGDFSTVKMPASYSLVFVVFQTLFNLPTQEAQVRGSVRGRGFRARPDEVRDRAGNEDEAGRGEPRCSGNGHPRPGEPDRPLPEYPCLGVPGAKLYSALLRYVWPSEMDLMAELAGMKLRNRFGGWDHEPFTAQSVAHLSVYEKPG